MGFLSHPACPQPCDGSSRAGRQASRKRSLALRTSSSPVLEKCHNLVVCLWCPPEVKRHLGFTVKTSALPHRTPAVWACHTSRPEAVWG